FDRRIADFFEIGERGVHHAGTWVVVAAGAVGKRLDDFVSVRRFLRQQRENHELQIFGAELAASAKAMPAEIAVAHDAAKPTVPMPAGAVATMEPECSERVGHGPS